MTTDPYTDPYADADRAAFGPGSQTPVAPDYGISDPFTTTATEPLSTETGRSGDTGSDTKQVAADQAGEVKDSAKDAAAQVAGTAKDEAGNVVDEAKNQASNLLDQAKGQAGQQAGAQQQRLADLVGSYAKELGSMASGSKESGALTDLTHQASQKAGELSHWLENHEPGQVLDEVRRFARRRPGTFLLGAVAAGVVVGRLTRGAVDDARSDDTHSDATRSDASMASTPQLSSGTTQPSLGDDAYAADPIGYDEVGGGYAAEPLNGYTGPATTPAYGTTPGDVVR